MLWVPLWLATLVTVMNAQNIRTHIPQGFQPALSSGVVICMMQVNALASLWLVNAVLQQNCLLYRVCQPALSLGLNLWKGQVNALGSLWLANNLYIFKERAFPLLEGFLILSFLFAMQMVQVNALGSLWLVNAAGFLFTPLSSTP